MACKKTLDDNQIRVYESASYYYCFGAVREDVSEAPGVAR